jgi:hypothetical protein
MGKGFTKNEGKEKGGWRRERERGYLNDSIPQWYVVCTRRSKGTYSTVHDILVAVIRAFTNVSPKEPHAAEFQTNYAWKALCSSKFCLSSHMRCDFCLPDFFLPVLLYHQDRQKEANRETAQNKQGKSHSKVKSHYYKKKTSVW